MESLTNILNESILDNDDVEAGLDKAMQDAKVRKLLTEFPVTKPGCDMMGRKLNVDDIVIFYPTKTVGNMLQFGVVKKILAKRITLMVPEYDTAGTYYVTSHKSNTVSLDTNRIFKIDDVDALLKTV